MTLPRSTSTDLPLTRLLLIVALGSGCPTAGETGPDYAGQDGSSTDTVATTDAGGVTGTGIGNVTGTDSVTADGALTSGGPVTMTGSLDGDAGAVTTGQGDGTMGSDDAGSSPGGEFAFVEDNGVDCEVGEVPAPGNDSTLPDPFVNFDGSRITTKAEWTCRRREIRKVMERYVYGEKPPRPDMVTGTISDTEITVEVSHGGQSTRFSAAVDLPDTGSPPYPVIIGYQSFGSISLDENVVQDEGVAIIRFNPYDAGAEGTGRNNKQGAFYTIHGSTHSRTGLLIAWAWGVSRLIDVIEADGDTLLKASGIGVTGCSRFGKGSFVAGAFDERIALGIPFESGTAGVPILRGIGDLEQSQSLGSAFGEQPWFGDDFQPFVANIDTLPLDTHATVAMYAPRGLLILDNPHIANLGPRAAHVAAQAGAEVFKALDLEGNISYRSDTANGSHCAARAEFAEPLRQALRKHLVGTEGDDGSIRPNGNGVGDLADWKEWDTPTLE